MKKKNKLLLTLSALAVTVGGGSAAASVGTDNDRHIENREKLRDMSVSELKEFFKQNPDGIPAELALNWQFWNWGVPCRNEDDKSCDNAPNNY